MPLYILSHAYHRHMCRHFPVVSNYYDSAPHCSDSTRVPGAMFILLHLLQAKHRSGKQGNFLLPRIDRLPPLIPSSKTLLNVLFLGIKIPPRAGRVEKHSSRRWPLLKPPTIENWDLSFLLEASHMFLSFTGILARLLQVKSLSMTTLKLVPLLILVECDATVSPTTLYGSRAAQFAGQLDPWLVEFRPWNKSLWALIKGLLLLTSIEGVTKHWAKGKFLKKECSRFSRWKRSPPFLMVE